MLQATTKEQRDYIKSLAIKESCDGKVSVWEDEISYEVDSCFDVSISFETMEKIVDYLRTSDKKDELFEECWKAYRRKGSKKKAREYWRKLKDNEKNSVLSHIKAYVASRELQFQKDFERYLRDKIFTTVVYQGSKMVYDPTQYDNTAYTPQGRSIWFDENTQSYWTDDNFYQGVISDGYTDDNRPDGATLTMSNARGRIQWDANTKRWEKK